MDTMQASTRTNGPCQQFGQLQSTFNQTTSSNQGSNGSHFILSMNTGFRQQVMYAQKMPMPGNSQLFSINNYKPQGMQQNLNGNLISQTENVPTSSSTMQAVYKTQQHSPVQNHIYNQSCQQTALPSYSDAVFAKNVYSRSSQRPSIQYMQDDAIHYSAPQANYKCTVQAGNAPFRTNNTSNPAKALTGVPVQMHYNSYPNQKHMQQPIVRGNRNAQTGQQQVINTSCNVSSMQLPSPTCLSENSNDLLHLFKRHGPPKTAQKTPTQDHSANSSFNMNTAFYQRINDVLCVNLNAPLTQTSPVNRSEPFEKTGTVSSAKASCGTSVASVSRAQRAVAVVLPLSQEDSPSKISPDASSDPCFSSDDNLMKNAQLSSPSLTKVQDMFAIVHKKSPYLASLLVDDAPNPSHLPLTYSQFKECITQNLKISRCCKKKLGNSKTPTEKKPSEEPLSSVLTMEWTLKTLTEKISEMENENKKSANEHKPYSVQEILKRFWNGSLIMLIEASRNPGLFSKQSEFKDLCETVDLDTVILSHMKSQTDLNRYHVLQHGEVYEEKDPYNSTWLNINSQLDDIDKEFGFPYFLKWSQYECGHNKDTKTHSGQKENVQTGVKTVQPEEPKTQNDMSDQTLTFVDCMSDNIDEEITTLLQQETNSHDGDKNKCESNEPSSDSSYSFKIEVLCPEKAKIIFEQMDHNSRPKNMEPSTSETTAPNDQNDAKKQTCHPTTIEMVCCIDKWKEKILGSTSEKKCKCKMVPNQNKEPQLLNTNDNNFSIETFDLTEDDGIISVVPLSVPEEVRVLSKSDDEIQVSEENQTPHSNHTHEQDFKSTETSLIASPDKNTLQKSIEHEREVTTSETICEIKQQGDDCRRGEGETVFVSEEDKQDSQLSLNDGAHVKKPQMDTSDAALLHPSKKHKLLPHLRSQTIFESFSKHKNAEPIASVQLALFGSRTKNDAPAGTRLCHSLSLQQQPPEKLYVQTNSLKTSDSQEDTESLSQISVKRRIHENWRKSFFQFPSKKLRKNNKGFAIIGAGPVKHKGVNSKRKVNNSNDGLCRKKKRTLTVSESVNLLQKPDDVEGKSLHKNVLEYKVLSSSFSFEEWSKNDDSAMDSTTRIPFLNKPRKHLFSQGMWCDDSRNKSATQSPTSSPESSSLFLEYQRQHKMRQKSTDE